MIILSDGIYFLTWVVEKFTWYNEAKTHKHHLSATSGLATLLSVWDAWSPGRNRVYSIVWPLVWASGQCPAQGLHDYILILHLRKLQLLCRTCLCVLVCKTRYKVVLQTPAVSLYIVHLGVYIRANSTTIWCLLVGLQSLSAQPNGFDHLGVRARLAGPLCVPGHPRSLPVVTENYNGSTWWWPHSQEAGLSDCGIRYRDSE